MKEFLAVIDFPTKVIVALYYKKEKFDEPKDLNGIFNLLQAALYLKTPHLVNLSLDLWFEHKNEIVDKRFAKVFDILDEDGDLKSYKLKLAGLLAKDFPKIYESGDFLQLNLNQLKDVLSHENFDKNLLKTCISTLLLKWRSTHRREDWKLSRFVENLTRKSITNHGMQLRGKKTRTK